MAKLTPVIHKLWDEAHARPWVYDGREPVEPWHDCSEEHPENDPRECQFPGRCIFEDNRGEEEIEADNKVIKEMEKNIDYNHPERRTRIAILCANHGIGL